MTNEEQPITDAELADIEFAAKELKVDAWGNDTRRLIAEVRRLRAELGFALDGETRNANALFSANVEIDNLRKMRDDARAEIEIIRAMNTKRYDALDTLRRMTEDVGLECWSCKGLRSVIDPALFVDGKAEVERLRKLETLRIAVFLLFSLKAPCENDLKALREAFDAIDPKPVPMCKVDPLGDIMPPARGEGGAA